MSPEKYIKFEFIISKNQRNIVEILVYFIAVIPFLIKECFILNYLKIINKTF